MENNYGFVVMQIIQTSIFHRDEHLKRFRGAIVRGNNFSLS